MDSDDSDIYYTTDGSDPYIVKESTSTLLVDSSTELHALIPSINNGGADIELEWKGIEDPSNSLNGFTEHQESVTKEADRIIVL